MVGLCLSIIITTVILDRLPIAMQTSDLPATIFRDRLTSTDHQIFRVGLRVGLLVGLRITTKVSVVPITTIKISTDLHCKDLEMGSSKWDLTTTTETMATIIREVVMVV